MSDTAEIIGYLRARFAEDEHFLRTTQEAGERRAAAATPGDLADGYALLMTALSDPQTRECVEWWGDRGSVPNNTGRLLADVASKRKILDAAAWSLRHKPPVPRGKAGEWGLALGVVENLAEPFRDRPDFPENWRLPA